ncbi:MAG: hypothetical protein WCI88_13800 [Chloroflexota bacterium]
MTLAPIPASLQQAAAFGQNADIVTCQRLPGAACCWNCLFSGAPWQARGWQNRKSFQTASLEYICCGKKHGGSACRS